ncbi:MAG: carboxypeptidase-like regulatory domain-containing protein [Acidobacteriia bacterium]|nr:carboxypeptidase-like regulatory domain-containing protein [Terriglobia bacterium]
MRLLACLLWAWSAFAADLPSATVTGRVFDVYHRPVRAAQVATMERRTVEGLPRLVAGARAIVDEAGMYRLVLPPGRYVLAVLPPPDPPDFAAVFPAYLGDIVDPGKAPSIEVRPGEIRPFTDFLLLNVESHRIAGAITGIPASGFSVTVSLYAASGFVEPLRTVQADVRGRFHMDYLPAGSYELKAAGPGASPRYGSAHIDLVQPEITGIQIHLPSAAR